VDLLLSLFLRWWKPLALALIVGGLLWWVRHGGYTDGVAKGEAERVSLASARDAALNGLQTAQDANAAQSDVIRQLSAENARWASEGARLAESGRKAVEAEAARAKRAEREAANWADRYARETGKPKCAAALAALPLACPNLKDSLR
jgi:type IV secretory pathway TrbL component